MLSAYVLSGLSACVRYFVSLFHLFYQPTPTVLPVFVLYFVSLCSLFSQHIFSILSVFVLYFVSMCPLFCQSLSTVLSASAFYFVRRCPVFCLSLSSIFSPCPLLSQLVSSILSALTRGLYFVYYLCALFFHSVSSILSARGFYFASLRLLILSVQVLFLFLSGFMFSLFCPSTSSLFSSSELWFIFFFWVKKTKALNSLLLICLVYPEVFTAEKNHVRGMSELCVSGRLDFFDMFSAVLMNWDDASITGTYPSVKS